MDSRAVYRAVLSELFLHRIRSEYDDVRFAGGNIPVRVRTTSHGISATIGKIGAAVGTFSFPLLQARFGLPGPMWVAGICFIAGFAVTWALLPEPNGLDLEEASHDSTFSECNVLQPARSA